MAPAVLPAAVPARRWRTAGCGHSVSRGSKGRVERMRCYREEGGGSGDASGSPDEQHQQSSGGGRKTSFVLDPEVSASGTLYPALRSHKKGHLHVSTLYSIYYEVFGNPKGRPAVFLHGGPGAGCSDRHARFFDPQQCLVVLFDQRGAGNRPLEDVSRFSVGHRVAEATSWSD